jgi:hypothetical protein
MVRRKKDRGGAGYIKPCKCVKFYNQFCKEEGGTK